MKSNTWLYGEGVEVPTVPEEFANERITLLKCNLEKVINVDFMERETVRVNDILNAIKYWEKLRDGKGI